MASISACATWLDRGPLRPFRSSVKLTGVAVRISRRLRHRRGDPAAGSVSAAGKIAAMSALRISAVTVTPVAFADPPLLNSVGVHEPFALRAVVEVSTDGGLSGLGETYADERHLAALYAAADAIVGADAYHTEQIYRRVQAIAAPDTPIASRPIGDNPATHRGVPPFEG